jgi:hypothetical protein
MENVQKSSHSIFLYSFKKYIYYLSQIEQKAPSFKPDFSRFAMFTYISINIFFIFYLKLAVCISTTKINSSKPFKQHVVSNMTL